MLDSIDQEIDRTLQRLVNLRAQLEQNIKACHDGWVCTRQLSRPFRSLLSSVGLP